MIFPIITHGRKTVVFYEETSNSTLNKIMVINVTNRLIRRFKTLANYQKIQTVE
jgi:hypothetical protein